MNRQVQQSEPVVPRPGLSRFGAAARVGLAVGLMLFTALPALGCNPITRYRVLSFFFDGVPPPAGMQGEQPAQVAADPGAEPEPLILPAEREPAVAMTPVRSSHAPYVDRLCFECHADGGYQTPSGGQDMCRKCHAPYFEFEAYDWAHGPVAAGDCSFCHSAHISEHVSLLTASVPDLCLRCHDADLTMAQPYHLAATAQPCSSCHDPHAAGNQYLLADSRSYRRRKQLPTQSGHTEWETTDCSRCHIPEKALEVVEEVDEICVSCHASVLEADPGRKLHTPVRQGLCVLCHAPHQSPREHLIRPAGEAICYECHDADEIRSPDHPRVERVDCMLCHAGHSSARPHLLRPGIPSTP